MSRLFTDCSHHFICRRVNHFYQCYLGTTLSEKLQSKICIDFVPLVFIHCAAGHKSAMCILCLENFPVKDKRPSYRSGRYLVVSSQREILCENPCYYYSHRIFFTLWDCSGTSYTFFLALNSTRKMMTCHDWLSVYHTLCLPYHCHWQDNHSCTTQASFIWNNFNLFRGWTRKYKEICFLNKQQGNTSS